MSSYKIARQTPNMWSIEEEFVHMYLIEGAERCVLVDTGMGSGNLRGALPCVGERPIVVVNTHGHFDHVGANRQFDDIYAHLNDHAAILASTGMEPECLRPIGEGDAIDLGDRKLEVFHGAGHTPGGILLLDREERILYGGDYVSDAPVFEFMEGADLRGYVRTLERIISLSGSYDRIAGGHGRIFQSVEQAAALKKCAETWLGGAVYAVPDEPFGETERWIYREGTAALYVEPR